MNQDKLIDAIVETLQQMVQTQQDIATALERLADCAEGM